MDQSCLIAIIAEKEVTLRKVLVHFLELGNGLPGGHKQRAHHHRQHRRSTQEPELGLLIGQYILDPAFYAVLAESYGARESILLGGGALQQHAGVGLSLDGGHVLHRPLVAAHFQVPAEEPPGKPHHGLEPIDADEKIANQLPPGVLVLQMGLLMGQNKSLTKGIQLGRDVYFGPHKAQHKGAGNTVTEIDIVP